VPHHVIQAIASEGLAQGSHVAARVGFQHAILRTQGIELTTEPLQNVTGGYDLKLSQIKT